jgi:hypothetical protein
MQMADVSTAEIACTLLGFQASLKINHWQTLSFANHKATDELVGTISGLTDKFMEALQGAQGRRLEFGDQVCSVVMKNVSDRDAKEVITTVRNWLVSELPRKIALTPGLTNIRDEMVTALDTTLYLLTFK